MTPETSNSDLPAADLRAALERFVVDNDDLLELESRIGKFNIFDALRIARAEIRHSNFLAFILDPAESHGQGQLFLQAVLMDLLKSAPVELRPLSPIDLDGTELRGVEVKREWKNIDVLITCKEPPFAVVIENKVDTHDHSKQLDRYSETMKEQFPGLAALRVYLTPDGDDPSEETSETWLPYKYAAIHDVLKRIRAAHRNAIGDDVLVFLDHYLTLLRTRFMNDKELDELCQRIYKNHRQALDLIWERVGNPDSGAAADVKAVLEQDGRWHTFYESSKIIEFVPKTWLEWLPHWGPYTDPRNWIFAHLTLRVGRIAYMVLVGPTKDTAKRSEIVTKLRGAAPNCGFKRSKATQVDGSWNRVSGGERIVEWSEEEEPDADAIRVAVKKKLDELYPKFEELAKVLKPLCGPALPTA